jgi:hypothetical protein
MRVRFVLSAIAVKQNTWLARGVGRLGVPCFFLVLRMPFLFTQMRPFSVAGDGSKCFHTFSTVRCGNVRNCSFSMASMSVGSDGQNKVWCIYLSACCLVGMV